MTWRAVVLIGRYGFWQQGGFPTEQAAYDAAGRYARGTNQAVKDYFAEPDFTA